MMKIKAAREKEASPELFLEGVKWEEASKFIEEIQSVWRGFK